MYYHRTYGSYITIKVYDKYLIVTKIINSQSIDGHDGHDDAFCFFQFFSSLSLFVRSFVRRIIHVYKKYTLFLLYILKYYS